jgi:hypothetical protein
MKEIVDSQWTFEAVTPKTPMPPSAVNAIWSFSLDGNGPVLVSFFFVKSGADFVSAAFTSMSKVIALSLPVFIESESYTRTSSQPQSKASI